MRGSTTFWRALETARRANLAERGLALPVAGADGLTRRNVLRALAATGLVAALPRPLHAAPGDGPVVIIGGGIAGLSALWHLTQAGIDARLYETRTRIGGRMFTAHAKGLPAFEMGGQLVNTDHADMHDLAREFGLALIDRKGGNHRTMILDGGAEIPEGKLASALRGIAGQIDADSVRLDQNYAKVAAELDQLSFTSYLDQHASLIPAPWVRRLMEATARTEYGCEPRQASAIELVFNLPAIDGRRIDVLSRSDERYLIAGGSSALAEAMAARMRDRITLFKRATRIDPLGSGASVMFSDGSKVDAAAVIVTTPASITKNIDFRVPLPALWRAFIAEVGLGVNGKVQPVMTSRPWERPIGRGGEIWQTSPQANCSLGWDGGVRPASGPGSVWTWFTGGTEVAAAAKDDPHAFAKRLAGLADAGVKGMSAATGATVRRTNWQDDPMARGAYVNFKPGQLTKFGSLIWTETDGIASNPPSAGPIHFAGEHLSDAYPGYMNGGAQTGRLAAASVIAGRAHARRFG